MECTACTSTKSMDEEIITHKYKECGLDNIVLAGLKRFHCKNCGEEYYNYGDINQLHGLIAELLIKKDSLLNGKEIRFLRTRLGYSGEMMANLLGYTKDHVYKIENGTLEITKSFDHMIRFVFINKTPDRYYDLHDLILNGAGAESIKNVNLTYTKKGWTTSKAA